MAGVIGDLLTNYERVRREYREKFAGLPTSVAPQAPDGTKWEKVIPVSLFYRIYDKPYAVGSVQMDLLLSESHSLQSTVTKHPVEQGAPLTDHIQRELREGKLTALVSNYSMQIGGGDGKTNRAMSAWLLFQNLWKRQETVTIVTTMEVYTDVAITSVSTERNDRTGDALEFNVSFQEIRRALLQEVTFSAVVQPGNMNNALNRQAAAKLSRGRQVGQDAVLDLGQTTIIARVGQ